MNKQFENIFHSEWAAEMDQAKELQNLTIPKLNETLCKFYAEVWNKEGAEY